MKYALSFFALSAIAFVHAQQPAQQQPTPDHAEANPGYSHQGEAFNDGPRQRAYLMGKTGNVRFPITTKSKEAQAFFEQGVGQLHGFWYFEAERSFRQVALLDPDCAMAYWGMAMANHENEKRAIGFAKKARGLLRGVSQRELLYIEGMTELLLAAGDKRKRQQTALDLFQRIAKEYPDDLEAKAFYVVRAWQWKIGLQGAALDNTLNDIFKVNALHPVHHYRIHIWDGANPSNALQSAALCGESAFSIAHMWHMPGHTYDKLKRYPEAAWQQEASSRADHFHMMRDRVLPDQIHNYAHNQEWLIRNLSHIGRVKDAVALAKNLIELPRHPRYNVPTKGAKSASYGRTRLFELLERYELWDETVQLADTMYLEPMESANEQIKRLRLIGLAHAGKGDREKLGQMIALLEKQSSKVKPPEPKKDEPKKEEPKDKQPDPKGKKKGPFGGPPVDPSNALKELQLLDKILAEEPDAAREMLKSMKGLSQTRQARYYLQIGDKAKAEQLAKQAADTAKGQVAPLALLIETLHAAGKTKECAEAFDRLRKMSGTIDSLDTPCFKRLAPIAKELKLPTDWRQPHKFPADFGKRPSLDSIGPLVWRPTPAPAWSLPNADGVVVDTKPYIGKPTLVIFYLGYGCSHCMEQVNKFSTEQKKFADAGITLLAISTDAQDALTRSLIGTKKPAFPVLSDPSCTAFKAYRAYDDFEQAPLHGTFLIDADGLVRWHDIGYEPFMDTAFVLAEAKRLLALKAR